MVVKTKKPRKSAQNTAFRRKEKYRKYLFTFAGKWSIIYKETKTNNCKECF